ncbi:hypothetical protein T484DRAFT_1954849 [Baffinella frigidus]|nr:hypothetical protein T484DRAFT_1954849 [Cryptophyta sp. CCMP2293]
MSPKEFPEESAPIAQPSSSPKKRTYVNPRSQLQIGGYSPVLDAAHDAGPGGGAGGAGAVQIGTDRAAEEYGGATRKDDAYAPRGERSGAEQGRDSPHPLDVDVAWIQKLAAAYSPRPRPEHPEFAKIMTLPPLEYLELPAAMVHVASGIANASTHLLTGANPGGKRGVFSAPEAPRPGGDQRALQARSNVAGQRPGTGVHTNGGREAGRRVVVAPAAPAVLSPRDFVSSPSPRRRHTAPMDFDGGVNSMPSVSVQGRPNDATPAARPEPRAEKHLSPPHPNRALSPLNMHRPHDATHHRASGGMLTDPPRDVRDQRDRGSQQSQPHGDRGSQQSQVHVYPSAGSHYHAPAPVPYSSNHYPASYSHGSSSHGQYTSAGQQGYAGLVSPVFSGVASPHFGGVVSPHGGGVSSRGGADMSPMRQTGSYSMAMAAAPRRGGGTNPMASPSSTYVGNHAVSHLSPAQHSLMSPRQPLGGGHSNPYTVSNHGLAAAMSPRMGGQQQNQYASPYYSVGSAGPRNAVSPFMSRVVGSGR